MQEKITFQTRDGQSLAGVIHRPDAAQLQGGKPRAQALFAHCFTCTKNIKAAVHIAEALCDEGIAVLRFDFTGLGQSEGDFAATHFSSNVQDLVDAADYLAREHQAPTILAGHSLGGTACLAAAHHIDSVKAVATIASPADAEHVLHLLQDDVEAIEKSGEARVNLGGVPFTLRKEFIDDVRSQSVRDGIRQLRRALLVMHSPIDQLVPVEEAARIYTSALHPKSFVSLDDADHLLSRERDSRYAGRVLAAWASRYVEEAVPAAAQPAAVPAAAEGAVVVSGRTADVFKVAINANGHALVGDEPESYGGGNTGPSPYDFLSAGLAACTVMTINMYARRKEWPVEAVEVQVVHGKIHAKDCADCETTEGKIDRFERQIAFSGELSEEQVQRLLEIADRCPVHLTLHREVKVDTRLAD